jgi:hypothetical protein
MEAALTLAGSTFGKSTTAHPCPEVVYSDPTQAQILLVVLGLLWIFGLYVTTEIIIGDTKL